METRYYDSEHLIPLRHPRCTPECEWASYDTREGQWDTRVMIHRLRGQQVEAHVPIALGEGALVQAIFEVAEAHHRELADIQK